MYLCRAVGEPQFDKTCLLVCDLPAAHSTQFGSTMRFHLARFAAVGRICNNAFLAKLNTGGETFSSADDHMDMLVLLIEEMMHLVTVPCRRRSRKWSYAFFVYCELMVFMAAEIDTAVSSTLSVLTLFVLELVQISLTKGSSLERSAFRQTIFIF